MLKKHIPLITSGLVLAAIVAFAGSYLTPYDGQICPEGENASPKDCTTYYIAPYLFFKSFTFLDAHGDGIIALFTIILAGSTILLWWSTRKLWVAGERQFALAHKEYIASHRPKIILREAYVASLCEGEPISVYMNFANVGESPGIIINSVVDLERFNIDTPRPLFAASVEPLHEIGTLRLDSGESRLIPFSSLNKRDNSPEVPKWVKDWFELKHRQGPDQNHPITYRNSWIHLVGQLTYMDAAGIQRRTAFRRQLIPEKQRFYRLEGEPDLDFAD